MARGLCLILMTMVVTTSAYAERAPLNLKDVVALARERAPATAVARARVEEASAELVGASQLALRNPSLDVDGGTRWGGGRWTDYSAALSVPLDLGGRRGKRITAAEAGIEHARAASAQVERETVAAAVAAYYAALHAQRRLLLAEERVRLATASEDIARARARAGDVAEFEVNLARGEVARANSAVVTARAGEAAARARLAVALGIPAGVLAVAGELADRSSLDQTTGEVRARPDVRTLAKEVDLARAEEAVAKAERWPSLDLRGSFEREQGTNAVIGGLTVELPVLARGQGDAARARARARRATTALELQTALAQTEIDSARQTYEATVAAAAILEREALPLSLENETSAAAAYRAGKLELAELLLIRREVLDTRREHLDRLLDAALAAVDLWSARGAPPLP